jgi:hypothetical protein
LVLPSPWPRRVRNLRARWGRGTMGPCVGTLWRVPDTHAGGREQSVSLPACLLPPFTSPPDERVSPLSRRVSIASLIPSFLAWPHPWPLRPLAFAFPSHSLFPPFRSFLPFALLSCPTAPYHKATSAFFNPKAPRPRSLSPLLSPVSFRQFRSSLRARAAFADHGGHHRVQMSC